MSEGKTAILKNGSKVRIRGYTSDDKEGMVKMYASLSPQSLRWSMPPYNRQRIDRWTSDLENNIILLAIDEGQVVGHLQISIAVNPRFRGTGELFIYVHQDFQNVGLGKALMREGISLARKRGLHRIELSVVADNDAGVYLYEKVGFQKEGTKRENYLGEDGRYHDEFVMGILL